MNGITSVVKVNRLSTVALSNESVLLTIREKGIILDSAIFLCGNIERAKLSTAEAETIIL